MKKIILFLTIIAVTLLCCQLKETNKTYAKEGDSFVEISASVENSSDEQVSTEVLDVEQQQNGRKETTDDYFINNILPILTGIGSAVLALLGFLLPYLKNHAKYKQLQGLYTQLSSDYKNLNTLLNSTDITQIKSALEEMFSESFKEQMTSAVSKLKIDEHSMAELQSNINVLDAKVEALLKGASVAWAAKPEAVTALVDAPSKQTLLNLTAYNNKLKEFIIERYGEDALNTISIVEGA